MASAAMVNRLAKLGLRQLAEEYKEACKHRILNNGGPRSTANERAWIEAWEHLKPVAERIEAEKEKAKAVKDDTPQPPPQLPGIPADVDAALDPNYQEADPGKRLRDGLLWVAEEFVGVITDTEAGPVANLKAASTPPPNRFALLTLATYALSPVDKRRELISRALAFAEKAHDVPGATPGPTEGNQSFLDQIA